jgi:hypothetical protein
LTFKAFGDILICDSQKGAISVRTALFFLSILGLTAAAANATPIILEAEDYVGSFNLGGDYIYITSCSGASGGYAVEGYDYPGDYIELEVDITQAGQYEDILRSGGELFEYSEHFATFRIKGGSTFSFADYSTMGLGIG